jgi:hypothetical protein
MALITRSRASLMLGANRLIGAIVERAKWFATLPPTPHALESQPKPITTCWRAQNYRPFTDSNSYPLEPGTVRMKRQTFWRENLMKIW